MKASAFVLAAVAQVASAHYFFDSVVVNGAPGKSFQFIRDFTRPTKFNPIKFSSNPAADIRDNSVVDGPDIRCNQGAFTAAGRTQVMTVNAGSEVKVKLGVGAKMQHPGPSLVYMSRAPGDNVKAYDGSGDWFKVYQDGVCNKAADFTKNAWCSYDKDTIAATIPKDTPSGEYLMRFEHIGVHRSHVNQPEHYVSCVQVKVTGGGSGTPGPTVKFPGAYKATDAYAKFSIYGGFKEFPFPGPSVWKGGAGASSAAAQPPVAAADTPAAPAPAAPAAGANCAGLYGQCGGKTFKGTSCCSRGSCKVVNEWYSQCV
ncbi:fungal cellulose binding domain-containing protein [Colletotrichum sublineola]|uniref:lytic cellulose monooxygenase (C4-dehydrogenating) n=1 Tax=Colletotrichum sublineola TaxID=1173701 RepID=A0A066XCW1_COLSU|nr:fungal cellulose binding domain-containing protein [Colletotrichum sublineola]KDN63586.1 putative fungal cellulose binding domain-containing protein [Colletotrichum sublineola]